MTTTDLVVVLPGITGSTLLRDGKPVWAVTPGTLASSIVHLGRQIDTLRLQNDIGDGPADDGIEPGVLMPTLHGIPGLWTPIKGYTELVEHLRALGYRESTADVPGNLLLFPYDWRLSNRFTARRLRPVVTRALDRLRSRGGPYADARLVFVCHSMGGLVARWYIEQEGGAEVTRKLITLGTPFRGAATALDQLVNGVPRKLRGLGPDLSPLVRSMPSMYELAPEYDCLGRGAQRLKPTEAHLLLQHPEMLTDAADFHAVLRAAEERRTTAVSEMTHAIVGIRQLTTTSLDATSYEPSDRYGQHQLFGDGTVPLPGAVRAGVSLDSNVLRRIADKHGNLHRNRAALDEIEGILTGQDVVVRGLTSVQPSVVVDDLQVPGVDIAVTVDLGENHGVRITLSDEAGRVLDVQTPRPRDGVVRTTFDGQSPGGYTVDVASLNPSSQVSAVSSDLIVMPSSAAK